MSEDDVTLCEQHAAHGEAVERLARGLPPDTIFAGLADVFRILGNAGRLKIVHALSGEEVCVCDLAALLGMSESAISHQLRLLRAMRLVRYRREGKRTYYALDDNHVRQLFAAALDHLVE